MAKTRIEWAIFSWNCVRGCREVSCGCAECYAARQARRHDHPGGSYAGLTKVVDTPKGRRVMWTGDVRLVPEKLYDIFEFGEGGRIFVNSMSDLFYTEAA